MSLKEVREMIKLMEEHSLHEIEIEREGFRIHLKKGAPPVVEASPSPGMAPVRIPVLESAAAPASPGGLPIKSPMVGTFYRAPAPDAPPFVEVGDIIEVGTVICIIEAMKLMNEIKAEVAGKITQALMENGDPVEFGQPLFLVEPA